jgi:hypothetical protein
VWHAICTSSVTVPAAARAAPPAREEDQPMNAMNTVSRPAHRRSAAAPSAGFVMHVAGAECKVRATAVWPIHEVLEVEAEMVLASGDHAAGEAELLVDMLESRMIAPPRPRRRRERPVSSRAVFYAGVDD